ncbi:uncharacterized protein [Ptychodera flava]|uniref:uncharacterized protein n=1 Tax=Ptychodera flava TaxID=63121 RepID=UPI00396A0100
MRDKCVISYLLAVWTISWINVSGQENGDLSCSPGYGLCEQENRCSYTLLLPPWDGRRCLPTGEALQTICTSSGGGEECSETRRQLQEELAKTDNFQGIMVGLLSRIDDLQYQKHILEQEVERQRNQISELINNGCQAGEDVAITEAPHSPCVPFPCENDATCIVVGAAAYSCLCPQDYTGTHCESPIDPKFIFNGTSSVIVRAQQQAAQLSEFTFCLWIKTRSDVTYDGYTALVHYQAEATVPTSRKLASAVSLFIGHAWQYHERGAGGGSFPGRIPTDGAWHHVCLAWVGRIGTGRRWLYVDGTGVILGDGHFEHMLGGGVVYLGHAPSSARRSHKFIGELSQFYMYDVKLDEQAIAGMVHSCGGSDEEEAFLKWPIIVKENSYTSEHIEVQPADICRRPGCGLETCMVGGACLENVGADGETCICANLEGSCPADQTSSKYVLDRSSRVSLSHAGVARNLSAVTFCLWTKTATTGNSVSTIFEFETSGSGDANSIKSVYIDHSRFLVTNYNSEQHRGYSRIGSGSGRVNDGSWHFLCVTGTLSDVASFHIYRDGIQLTRSLFRQELRLFGAGTVRLGFSPIKPDYYAFRGDVYGFQMWPLDLSENRHQMFNMFRQCGRYTTEGAVINWADFKSDNNNFHGSDVEFEAADICLREN